MVYTTIGWCWPLNHNNIIYPRDSQLFTVYGDTNMRHLFFVLFALLSPATVVFGQERPDFQLRLPIHVQVLPKADPEAKNRFGLAFWGILLDVTAENILPDGTVEDNGLATLLVGGFAWQHDKKNWLELLVGQKRDQNGYKDPIVNMRFMNNQVPYVTIAGEIQQSFRNERKRFFWWVAADTPVHMWKLRAGVETENIHSFGKTDVHSIGPRMVMPLPLSASAKALKVGLVTTYQFRKGNGPRYRDFVRVYIITNLSF